MARDLKNRGFSSSYDPSKYNANRFRNWSASPVGSNLRDRAYPSSFGSNSGSLGASLTRSFSGGGSSGRSGGLGSSMGALGMMGQMQANPWDDYLNQRKGLLQAAYDKNMGALEDAFAAYMSAMEENLSSAQSALQDSYNRSAANIKADAAQSLKQAYVNKMLSEKNFDQKMAAQGLSGGASETTRAAMSNNYGNARTEINNTTNRNLSELEGQYNENLAAAYQAYNQAVAQAQLQKAMQAMELENMLAEGQLGALDDYYGMMGEFGGFGDPSEYSSQFAAIGQGLDGFEFDPTEAKNSVKPVNIVQSDIMAPMNQRTSSNLMSALEDIMAQMQRANGQGMPTRLNNNYIASILNMLKKGGIR